MHRERKTTRQRIATLLRSEPTSPGALATEFGIRSGTALSHVEHLSKTLDSTDEELLVDPPTCRECGFSTFDELLNIPSRCPDCKSERVSEPVFTIE